MAIEQGQYCITLTAGADLSGSQYKFVELGAALTCTVCNGATDIPIGVLQNKPTSGMPAEVMVIGMTKVQGDAGLSVGALIGTSADGQADAKTVGTDTTEYVVGRVLEGTSNAAELATVLINCAAPHRAA
jgi:hypothetical protein